MTTEIRPTFDPSDGLWHEGRASGRTIRELLTRLPAKMRVADYFPAGREVSSAERGFCVNDAWHVSEHGFKLRPKMFHAPSIQRRTKMVHAPSTRRQTAERISRPNRDVSRILGVRHVKLNAAGERLYDLSKILEWWQRGMLSGEIAASLGVGAMPDTVAAMISIARQRGDQRAWYSRDPRRAANRIRRMTGSAT